MEYWNLCQILFYLHVNIEKRLVEWALSDLWILEFWCFKIQVHGKEKLYT